MNPIGPPFLLQIGCDLLAKEILTQVPELEKTLSLHTILNAPDSFGKRLVKISLENLSQNPEEN
jgi:hypothetical protein